MSMDSTIITDLASLSDEDENTEPYLITIAGHNIGKLFHLNKEELTAGRSQDCGIWIEDNTISRQHFQVQRKGKNCILTDLNSTNGTYVNGQRVKSVTLHSGDKIQISKETIIQFDYFDENRRMSEEKRYELGVKDPFTGTYNKSFFLQRFADEFMFSKRQNQPLSLVIFDIDHFKKINDTYGHLAGDKVLQELSKTVSSMIRLEDVFCRYGGEEFVIIMRNTSCQDAVNLSERIRMRIESTVVNFEEKDINVTISLGVSTLKEESFEDYVAMLAEADRYLYHSKGHGRNQVSAKCKPNF